MEKKEIKEIEFNSAEFVRKFVKKYNKEFKRIFSKDFKALDEEKIEFSELMDALIDEARNTGISGGKIYRLFKEEFKLNYKDLDKVLSAFKERLVPVDDGKEAADTALEKRQKYIREAIAAFHANEEKYIK